MPMVPLREKFLFKYNAFDIQKMPVSLQCKGRFTQYAFLSGFVRSLTGFVYFCSQAFLWGAFYLLE